MTFPGPRLREDIDAIPAGAAGPGLFVLFDTTGLAPGRLAVSPAALRIAAALDGERTILDLREYFHATWEPSDPVGPAPDGAAILRVVEALDAAFFLDNERFAGHRAELTRAFLAGAERPATSAGPVYPEEPEPLREALARCLADAPAAEEPPENAVGLGLDGVWPTPRGAAIPHIDYVRGWAGYGQVYKELARSRPAETVYILGTAHRPLRTRYALCAKDFATPLGIARHDGDACAELSAAGASVGVDWSADAVEHLYEHSVELQAVWLKWLWPGAKIVPLLCGGFSGFLRREDGEGCDVASRGVGLPGRSRTAPWDDPEIAAMAKTLATASRRPGTMLLASVDLSHLGPRFHPDEPMLTDARLAEAEAADRVYLKRVAAGDARGALSLLASTGDAGQVCGAAALYLLGAALPDARGRLLGYHQAAAVDGAQAVTFAGMVFDRLG